MRLSRIIVRRIRGPRVITGCDYKPEGQTSLRHVGQRPESFHDPSFGIDREIGPFRRILIVVVGQLVPDISQFSPVQILRFHLQHGAADFFVIGHGSIIGVLGVPFAGLRIHERGHVVVDVDHLDVQLYIGQECKLLVIKSRP